MRRLTLEVLDYCHCPLLLMMSIVLKCSCRLSKASKKQWCVQLTWPAASLLRIYVCRQHKHVTQTTCCALYNRLCCHDQLSHINAGSEDRTPDCRMIPQDTISGQHYQQLAGCAAGSCVCVWVCVAVVMCLGGGCGGVR